MSAAQFVTVEMLEARLERCSSLIKGKLPIALHAWPKCKKSRFCGVGPVDWGGDTDPPPFFDVYVGSDAQLYHDINRKLQEACDRVGIMFMSMA